MSALVKIQLPQESSGNIQKHHGQNSPSRHHIASPQSYFNQGVLGNINDQLASRSVITNSQNQNNNDDEKFNSDLLSIKVENILKVLKKEPEQRNSLEIHQITPFFKEIELFKEKDIKDNYFLDIVSALKYEHFQKGEFVFQDGDQGDKFYIILQGRVSVQLPYFMDKSGTINRSTRKSNAHSVQQRKTPLESQTQREINKSRDENEIQLKNEKQNKKTKLIDLIQMRTIIKIVKKMKKSFHLKNHMKKLNKISIHLENCIRKASKRSQGVLLKNKKSKQALGKQSDFLQTSQQNSNQDQSRYHTEVKQLFAGSGFGELALKSDKPRQASIQCLEDCDLASMQKKDYLRILAKIHDKSKEELIQFFSSTPYFGHWSRSMIVKLLVSFHKRKITKDQVMVQEGTKNSYLFLIKEGEFEVTKKVKKDMRSDIDYSQFVKLNEVGEKSDSMMNQLPYSVRAAFNNVTNQQLKDSSNNSLDKSPQKSPDPRTKSKYSFMSKQNPDELVFQRQTLNKSNLKKTHITKTSEHTFMFLGQGQVFGEESMILGVPALYSVRCRSAIGEIFIINELEFGRRIKSNELSTRVLEQNCDQKAKAIAKALLTNNSYIYSDLENKGAFYQYEQEVEEKNDQVLLQSANFSNKQIQPTTQIQREASPSIQKSPTSLQTQNQGNNKFNSQIAQSGQKQAMSNSLLNQRELDFRQTMKEIVNRYPAVSQQRRIVRKEYNSKVQQIKEIIEGPEDNTFKDPQIIFQEQLAQTLSKSTNKRELINILKRKLVNAVETNPQDHLKLIDRFLQSKIVKRYTQAQKKHYMSSKVSDAIEKNEGYDRFLEVAEVVKQELNTKKNNSSDLHNSSPNIKRSTIALRQARVASAHKNSQFQQRNNIVNQNQKSYYQLQAVSQSQRASINFNQRGNQKAIINSVNQSLVGEDFLSVMNSGPQSPQSQVQIMQKLQQPTLQFQNKAHHKRYPTALEFSQNLKTQSQIPPTAKTSAAFTKSVASDRDFSQIFQNYCDNSTKYMSIAQTIRKNTPSRMNFSILNQSILLQQQQQQNQSSSNRLNSGDIQSSTNRPNLMMNQNKQNQRGITNMNFLSSGGNLSIYDSSHPQIMSMRVINNKSANFTANHMSRQSQSRENPNQHLQIINNATNRTQTRAGPFIGTGGGDISGRSFGISHNLESQVKSQN